MNPRSAIAKGKRFENWIAEQIEMAGLGDASREIGSGSGKKKGDIRSSIPFLIEAKNEEGVAKSLLDRIDQAKEQARIGFAWPDKWALVIRDPRIPETQMESYAIIDFQQFLELLRRAKEPKVKEPDKSMAWKIRRLIGDAKEVLKELEI